MPATQTLVGTAIVAAGLTLLPGPSNVFILSHGIGRVVEPGIKDASDA